MERQTNKKHFGGITIMKNLLSNSEHIAMIKAYKATKDDFIFADLFAEVQEVAEKLAYKEWDKSKGLNIPKDDFVSVAYEAVLKSINSFDGEQGSNFVSFVKKNVLWSISDGIYKKSATKAEQFHKVASVNSLDKTVSHGEETATFGDLVAIQFATDADAVFESVFTESDESSFMDDIKVLVSNFSDEANADDSNLIKLVFSTILTTENPTAKVVNSALSTAMPDVKSATLRKRKSRAIDRFTNFAKENGFVALDLSQF
jgi:hypothetical protein